MRRLPIALLLLATAAAAQEDLAPRLRSALVEVHVASQRAELRAPWQKERLRTWVGLGVVVDKGVILTPANVVRHAIMIEVAVANSARRYLARLKHVDSRLGLALVEVTDPDLRDLLQPLPIGDPVGLDDEFDVYQIGSESLVERSTARVVRPEADADGLKLRVKTTCSDVGRGQTALREGRIVGMLIQTNRSRQEGVLLSVETIRHYLDDLADGNYAGQPGPGLWIQGLLREDLRAYYGVGQDQHGVVVTRVMEQRTGDGVLQAGDVVLAADGYDLDDEGRFVHEVHGRLSAAYLFQGRRYAGDRIPVRVLRGGEVLEREIELRAWPDEVRRVPEAPADGQPSYLVTGGLVILELSQEAGAIMPRTPGGVVLRRYRERDPWDPANGRRRYVYVDRVLADASNKGFEELSYAPILSVNGKPVGDLADVARALAEPAGAYHVFRFEGLESDFVVEAARLEEIDRRIAATYKIPALRHLRNAD